MQIIKQINPDEKGIIITSDENKYNLMREISEVEQMFQLPIFTLGEIKTIINGEFDEEAVVEIVKYYKEHKKIALNINVAKKYLQTIEQLDIEQDYCEQLLRELVEVKKYLLAKRVYHAKAYRKNLLYQKQVYCYDVIITSNLREQIVQLSQKAIIDIQLEAKKQGQYYEFNTISEEVEFVCLQIAKLLDQGISANKIKLHIPQGEYVSLIMMYFDLYKIKHNLAQKRTLLSYDFIKKLLEKIKLKGLTCLNEYEIENPLEQQLYNQAIQIINRYPSIHHDVELLVAFLTNDFAMQKIKTNAQSDVIEQVNWQQYQVADDEYLFCFNFAEGRVPKIKQDTAIISDKIAKKYNYATSQELNSLTKEQMIRKINTSKNLVLTFARNAISGEEARSSLLDKVELSKQTPDDSLIRYSQSADLLSLAKADELRLKYDTKHQNLQRFAQHYPYKRYVNQINNQLYQKVGQEELKLSATSIQKFFECEYKFYLNKILKVNLQIGDPTMINIGNLYHYVLEKAQRNRVDSVEEIREIIKQFLIEERVVEPQMFSMASEAYYLERYALYLHEIISEIYDFHSRSEFKLKDAEFEREFAYTLDQELKIKLIGKVDKYVELDLDNKFYIIIIDYKTKNKPNIDHRNFEYGFELQNFIYLNLIKQSQGDDEIELIGTYQQRIKPQHQYGHEAFNDDFKLFGYTTSAMHKVRQLEPNYQDKELTVLANAKTKANGEKFDRYAKIYDEEALAKFEQLIENKLTAVVNRIKKANYQINPKKLKGKNVSCTYCDYQAICYRAQSNIIELKEEDND